MNKRRKFPHERHFVKSCTLESPAPGSRSGPWVRSYFILECIVSGYGSITINGKTFRTGPGDCYVLLPGDSVIHTTDTEDPRINYWISIQGLSLSRYFKAAGITSENPFIPKEACPEVLAWVKHMTEHWNSRSIASDLRQTACIYGILGAMLEGRTFSQDDHLIEKAIGIMELSFHQPIDIAYLSKQVGLTRAYFSELFKKKTGKSPHQYLTSLRIESARYLLIHEPGRTISEIAELVGLDPQNFSRLFKKETSLTPLSYKKRHSKQ